MKKQMQNIIICCVLLALLVGVFFLVSNFVPDEDTSKLENTNKDSLSCIITKPAEEIESVTVENKSEKFTIDVSLEDKKAVYKVKNTDLTKQTAQSNVQMFMDELLGITPIQLVESGVSDFAKYGFYKNEATITVYFRDNTTTTLKLGDEAPANVGRYLRVNDEDTVYLIDNYYSNEIFLQSKNFYLDGNE